MDTTLSGPDMSSRDAIFTGRGLNVLIAVSYDGGGDSDTELLEFQVIAFRSNSTR